MESTHPDHYTVLDTVEDFTGAGHMQVPTFLPLPGRHQIFTDLSFEARSEFEQHLRQSEDEARSRYCAALGDMRDVHLQPWFVRQLQTKIVPALKRIGFDVSLGWALFKMAAPAWESMGPITAENI